MAASNLFLQLQDTIEQSLRSRRTAWYIDIHWNDPVTATNYWIGVVIVAATICTADDKTGDRLKLLEPVPFDFLHQTKRMVPLLGLHQKWKRKANCFCYFTFLTKLFKTRIRSKTQQGHLHDSVWFTSFVNCLIFLKMNWICLRILEIPSAFVPVEYL